MIVKDIPVKKFKQDVSLLKTYYSTLHTHVSVFSAAFYLHVMLSHFVCTAARRLVNLGLMINQPVILMEAVLWKISLRKAKIISHATNFESRRLLASTREILAGSGIPCRRPGQSHSFVARWTCFSSECGVLAPGLAWLLDSSEQRSLSERQSHANAGLCFALLCSKQASQPN